jgi:hypothetical protein
VQIIRLIRFVFVDVHNGPIKVGKRDKVFFGCFVFRLIPICFLGGPVEVGEIAGSRKRIYVAATPLGFITAPN